MKINSGEQLRNMMADRPNVETKGEKFKYDHARLANQFIKVINVLNIDPFVKKVVTLRLMSPIITGRERSYVSIAIELGATERDVAQADAYGAQLLQECLERNDTEEMLSKFNSDRAVENAVRTVGNSIVESKN